MGARGLSTALVTALAAALPVFGLAGCGDSEDTGSGTGSTTLTIYSSLPLQGPSRFDSLSIISAEKLALEQIGGRVGQFTIKYVSLDDSSARKAGWDPGVTITNARSVVQDKGTIAYLGDFDTGASAISIPLLNSASILQLTPSNSAVGLTQLAGGDKGEPEKYYPSGKRTFGRMVPGDQMQAAAQVHLQKAQGCMTTYLLDDGNIDGEAIVRSIGYAAAAGGLRVTGGDEVQAGAPNLENLASKVAKSGADCVFIGAGDADVGSKLFDIVHASVPSAKLFGSAGVATPEFASAIDPDTADQTYLTSPVLAGDQYPATGRRFIQAYTAKYGEPPRGYAIYGYEAMRAALAAVRAAGAKGNDRRAVVKAFFAIRNRNSVLGTYSVDSDGDTTLRYYGIYTIDHGALAFYRKFELAP